MQFSDPEYLILTADSGQCHCIPESIRERGPYGNCGSRDYGNDNQYGSRNSVLQDHGSKEDPEGVVLSGSLICFLVILCDMMIYKIKLTVNIVHAETECLLSRKKPDSYIHADVEFEDGEGKGAI